jgi:hypothetical protein
LPIRAALFLPVIGDCRLIDFAVNQAIDDFVKNFGMAKMFGFLYIFNKSKSTYG